MNVAKIDCLVRRFSFLRVKKVIYIEKKHTYSAKNFQMMGTQEHKPPRHGVKMV